jgi:hypothetical protein
MSFLKNLFKKKPGGSFFGNLLRSATSAIPIIGGTVVGTGANKIELGQTKTNAQLAKEATFAGVPASVEANGDIAIKQPLNEVNITAQSLKKDPPIPAWMEKLGDSLSYLGKRTTDQTAVGMDDKTLFIIGGGILLLVGVIAMNKK